MPKVKPLAIRIEVPAQYGTAYNGEDGRQWVERRQRVSGKALRDLDGVGRKLTGGAQDDLAQDAKEAAKAAARDKEAFEKVCKVLAGIFTDWNLEGDKGPLPKPWGNPKAFAALFDSDFTLLVWVGSLPFVTVGDLFDSKN